MFVKAHAHELRYLFLDFNAYFASVEQHDEPALRGRPVMVTPLASEHSGAIAASYEAKALGISRGTSVRDARQICPDIVVRPARHDRYVIVHGLLMAEIRRHIPITQICSIDECLCALDETEAKAEVALAKAHAIKRGLAANIGASLRASIGLSTSPLLAKIAAEMHKPDGLTLIDNAMLPDALAGLPLRDIPGIGGGMETRLARAGVYDFLSLWRLQPKQARALWGSVEGERFYYGLHGYDVRRSEPSAKQMIGHSRVLSGPHRRPDAARIVVRALILKAASRLRHYALYASAFQISMKSEKGHKFFHEERFRSTQNSWRFLRLLEECWPAMVARLYAQDGPRTRLKSVSCSLHCLSAKPPPLDLFVSAQDDAHDAQQAELWSRIDGLNHRYGKQTIGISSQIGLDLNYLGVKVAFSRVPDEVEFKY